MKPLASSLFKLDTIVLAQELVGKLLYSRSGQTEMVSRIVETEAYLYENDPACHASRGKTARNAPMFNEAGIAYVYLIYGIHYCFNVVSGPEGVGEAVLIRATEPLAGVEEMQINRAKQKPRDLCSGPGKLCQAHKISKEDNRSSLCSGRLRVLERFGDILSEAPACLIETSRVGISSGNELPYRFYDSESLFVSQK